MKRSIPLTAVLCAALLLSVARGRAQDLYVGSNAANVTTNFTSGTNRFNNTYVGYTTNATNNLLNVSGAGTVLTNTNDLIVGNVGSGNRLVISNGGQVFNRSAYLGYGVYTAMPWLYATNNSALVTGTNSRWTVSGLEVGYQGNASSLVISNGGQVSSYQPVRIGPYASGNSVLVSGAGSSLLASVQIGEASIDGLSYNNSLVVSNGGVITGTNAVGGGSKIGWSSSNNNVLITGNGSVWTESGLLSIGLFEDGISNRLVISNGGTVTTGGGVIGVGGYTNDPPLPGNAGNSVRVTGTNSLWTSTGQLVVGQNSDGNSLTISDGGSVVCGTNLIINQYYPNTNGNYAGSLVQIDGGRLVVTNGRITFGAGLGTLQVDGGTVEVKELLATTPITPSGQILPAERRGSYVLLNGGTIISGATTISNGNNSSDDSTFYVGGTTGSGAAFIAKGGTHTFWADVTVGRSGSSNSLVITNGAEVFLKSRPIPSSEQSRGGTNFVIGVAAGAANNSVSISSGRLVMTNGTLEIGRAGSGTLSIHGGTVEAPSIVVASQAGSSGTLNIGRFGTNDAAGTINAPSIAFGAGTGVINFNQSNATTISAVISGAGTLRQLGSGTTTLSASNTYTGGTTISAGTLELDNTGSVAGNITNNATLSINRTNSLTLTNLVSGTGALSKSGAGTVIFTGANTYSGGTTISAGTLQINAGGVVSNSATTLVGSGGSGTLNISGGTYSNFNVSIGHSGGTGILNLNSGSLSAQNLAVSGNSAAAGTLNLNGGTMAVAGSFVVASGGTINVNTGGVLRGGNGGHLSADATNSLINFNGGTGSAGLNLFVGNGGTVDLRGQSLGTNNWGNLIASAPGGVLRNSGTNASTIATANTIWLWQGGQKLIIDASGGDILINSWITSSLMTNTGIIKTGSKALVLTYSGNDYNGATLLQQGSLRLDHANAAGSGAITQSNAASTLQINATGTVSNAMSLYNIATLQTVTLSGSKTLNGTTYNVAAGTTTTESGVLSGAGGLTKSGTGTMTLSASNSYSGTTTVSAGVLSLANTNALSASTLDYSSAGRVSFSNLTGANLGGLQGSTNLALTNASGGAVALNVGANNSNTTYSGILSGGGSLTKVGAGTMILSGANTYSGTTTISAGTVAISNGASFGSNTVTFASNGTTVAALASVLVTNNYALTGSGTMDVGANVLTNSGVISGAGGLTKAGAGTMVLGAANTYTGGTTINAGTVAISNGSSFGNNTVTFASNGTTVAALASVLVTNNYALTGSGTMDVGANILTNSGVISGAGSLTKAGAGTMILGAANTYSGTTTISAGTLQVGNGGTTGTLGAGNVANGGTLVFNRSDDSTYSGIISGSGEVTKSGIGRLSLSGSSSYTGATTVSAGDLNLSGGSITNSAVTVASGASLSGYGSVGTIGGAGAINPGNSPGILTTPQVNPSAGTSFNFEMTGTAPIYSNAASSTNDLIRITGMLPTTPFSQALTASNGINIYFSGAALFTGSTAVQYKGGFFTDQSTNFASSITNATYNYYFADAIGTNSYNGVNYYNKAQYESLVLGTNMLITVSTVAQTANFGSGNVNGQVMQIDVIPEPSTYALLALAVAGWGAHAWRRRKQVS